MNILRDPPSRARLADGVARHGFRTYYERQLVSSHGYLLLALLSFIALLAGIEAVANGTDQLVDALLAFLSGAVALWAGRRYLHLLLRAETLARQANCTECGEYGRLQVMGEDRRAGLTQVRCRRCDHRWSMEDNG